MNTLPLLTHIPGGELHPNDLQVLREFALDAPPEWRNAFNRLIAAAEEDAIEEKLRTQIDELEATHKVAQEKAAELFKNCESLLSALQSAKASVPWLTLGGAYVHEKLELLSDGLEELADELTPDPASASAQPPASGGSAAG